MGTCDDWPVLSLVAAIPYTTFPTISLGPLNLRTFGFVVAIGVLIGAWLAARYGEEHGIPRDTTYSLAMRMVVAGVIGSRITWVASHLDDLDSPLDAFAIWQGGLQFSGGFVLAVIAGYPVYRHWNRLTRWHSLDGYAYGLAIGLGIGRIACYSVGEHFGRLTSFALGVRYDGGSVRESTLGDLPLRTGMVFHQTALYELFYMAVLFLVLTWILHLRTRGRARHRDGRLLRLVRRGPLRLGLATGQRRARARPHRRAVPVPHPAPHERVDLVPGAQDPRPGHRGRDGRGHPVACGRRGRRRLPLGGRRLAQGTNRAKGRKLPPRRVVDLVRRVVSP